MELPKMLTVKQVANHLQVSEVTVRRWIAAGTLRSVKIGRARRIPQEALLELIQGTKKEDES